MKTNFPSFLVQLKSKKMSKKCRRFDYHHRLPQSRGGTDTYPAGNLVRVNKVKHAYWHALFANRELEDIVEELNRVWIDPRMKLTIEQR
jgi:hypothetical protein